MRLQGKRAIVTGGGSGFGAGIARKFAAENAEVWVADINKKAAKAIAKEIDGKFVEVDVASDKSVKAMRKAVGNDAAAGQIFNAVTNRAVTLNGMVAICAKAAGVTPTIVNYDVNDMPPGVEVSSREPMLSGAEHYRKTGVKFTGTRLTTKRGHTKRKK